MSIFGEINCIGVCLQSSDLVHLIALLLVISIALAAARMMQKNPGQRLLTFISSQFAVLGAILATFYLMECSEMLTVYLYFAYVVTSSVLIFGILRYYDTIMIKRHDAKPLGNLIKWTQDFVNSLTSATVYYYDSAVPHAFAAGRSIFVSIGLLETLNDNELKAVLAHEAWHIHNNSKTPFLRQLALMTFSYHRKTDLEEMADRFASGIAGSDALLSARNKVDKVFN